MSERDIPSDDIPDGPLVGPPGPDSDPTPADSVRAWALEREREWTDPRFEVAMRELDIGVLKSARAYARHLLGDTSEEDDACQNAIIKALDKFDPARGVPFSKFFMSLLPNESFSIHRRHKTLPSPMDPSALHASAHGSLPDVADPEAEAIRREFENLILSTLQKLEGLSDTDREALLQRMDGRKADRKDAERNRKRIERARPKLYALAGLTPDERDAVSLQLQHVALDKIKQGFYSAAKQKMLSLFNLTTEDDLN